MKKLIFLTLFVVFTTALPATATLGWVDLHSWNKSSATMLRDVEEEIKNFNFNTCPDLQNTMSIMKKMEKSVPLNEKDNAFLEKKMLILKKKGDDVKSLKEQIILINEDIIRRVKGYELYLSWYVKVSSEFNLYTTEDKKLTQELLLSVKSLHEQLRNKLTKFKKANFKKQQENPRQNDGDSFLYLYFYFKKNLL